MISVEEAKVRKEQAIQQWLVQIEQQADSELGRYGTFAISDQCIKQATPLIKIYEEAGFKITRDLVDSKGEKYMTISIPEEPILTLVEDVNT